MTYPGGWCRHYTGRLAGTCAAGVPYAVVADGPLEAASTSLPCYTLYNPAGLSCPHRDCATDAEWRAELARYEAMRRDYGRRA